MSVEGLFAVNEGSAIFLTFGFKSESGSPTIPTTVEWRLDNKTADLEAADWASIVPDQTVNLTVPGSLHVIQDAENISELFEVTVRVNAGQPTQAHATKEYRVMNIHGAP